MLGKKSLSKQRIAFTFHIKRYSVENPKDWRFRTHNLKVPSFGESLKIPVCGHCAVVCRDFEIIQSSPVCGPCVVVCEDFEFSEFP